MVLFKKSTVSEAQVIPMPKRSNAARRIQRRQDTVDAAIYSFIKALKILKRRRISTYNIAVGLEIPQIEVTKSIERLRDKGVGISKL
jgi:hypothetical protein